jgi:hypothetical protein
MVRFQRQPPGTALTRSSLLIGGGLAVLAGWWIIEREPVLAGLATAVAGALLLLGGHRANHGAGGPVDRMLDDLLDRVWDVAVLAPIAWVAREGQPVVAAGALVALGASYVSSYVRARGAALSYSVEESHVTRGIRYGLLSAGLVFGWLPLMVWLAAAWSTLAAVVRTGQVAREERG